MVPRSYAYGAVSPPATKALSEKEPSRSYKTAALPSRRAATAAQQIPIMARTPSSRHASLPSRPVEIPDRVRTSPKQRPTERKASTTSQCSESVPASVAALLAMTTIPPHRPQRVRRRRTVATHMSIEELVESWKSDDTLRPSLASSPSMSVLLEEPSSLPTDVMGRAKSDSLVPSFFRTRSVSTDSVPSLDEDRSSLLSMRSPSTPGSLKSRHSSTNLRRERLKSASLSEDCMFDHPLISLPSPEVAEEATDVFQSRRESTTKGRFSFRSNLTTSLQALKNAALSSISSLKSSSQTAQKSATITNSNQIDDALWSRPFLFPRLSSEIRPTIQGTPTMAQRRYLNPMPLTFEEQEAPFQKALHAPYLAEAIEDVPTIQLQTYTRRRRGASRSRVSTPDPQSEAGRAQQLGAGIRQREPRENADFLRVVVLEMNMRRAGKLESGRARIWLPPRQVSESREMTSRAESSSQIPARWRGISAT